MPTPLPSETNIQTPLLHPDNTWLLIHVFIYTYLVWLGRLNDRAADNLDVSHESLPCYFCDLEDAGRVREIAALAGITERAVLRIIQELSDAGFVVIEKVGREKRCSVTSEVPLRHPLEQYREVSELLEMLPGDDDERQ